MRTSILKPPESGDLKGPASSEVAVLTWNHTAPTPPLDGSVSPPANLELDAVTENFCNNRSSCPSQYLSGATPTCK
ncbi:hypothetical protein EXN66_Car004038 [Channa argus]|uniref:Uncharacterized protein n=1 Tax=Channa argus TaxID=215402 RepID=A0A6G1PEA4_CHAAH|nr:hypothetical protein EXN66_Car004038 [Channa argus]